VADEISGGGPVPTRHPARTALVVLVAAVAVVAGIASLRRGIDEPVASAPTPSVRFSAPVPQLDLGAVCSPVRTDGHSTLTVAFTVRNVSADPVGVVKIVPLLFPGLRWLETQVQDGSCRAPGADLGRVPAHGTALATMHLELPQTCPAPIPIEVTVTEQHADGQLVDGRLHLLDDLGALHFTTC
jgi:hypothetical protein